MECSLQAFEEFISKKMKNVKSFTALDAWIFFHKKFQYDPVSYFAEMMESLHGSGKLLCSVDERGVRHYQCTEKDNSMKNVLASIKESCTNEPKKISSISKEIGIAQQRVRSIINILWALGIIEENRDTKPLKVRWDVEKEMARRNWTDSFNNLNRLREMDDELSPIE